MAKTGQKRGPGAMGRWKGVRTQTTGGEVTVRHVEPTADPMTPGQEGKLRELCAELGEEYVAPLSKASASKAIRRGLARVQQRDSREAAAR